jgi:glucose-6-phosphate isomerase
VQVKLRLPAAVGAPAGVAGRIFDHDTALWGPDAAAEASIRLGWVDLPETSQALIDEIVALRDDLVGRGLTHVVLCGMGGSSLAPEVICAAAGVPLTVLDSSHPDTVRGALADRLDESVVVVSSKSGGTVETDSLLRSYIAAFERAGRNPADHLVVVTDPDSPFDREATEAGYRVFRADPNVGGRYSALSAFGLVPSGLAGADIAGLLGDALTARSVLSEDGADNPALQLGAALGAGHRGGVDKLTLFDASDVGLGDWIEQLVAESTGKIGRGILPVVVPTATAPNFSPSSPDEFLAVTGSEEPPAALSGYSAAVNGPLGAQFLLWETAVAVAGLELGINPFDQPDVESAKQAARTFLTATGGSPEQPAFSVDGVAAFGTSASTLTAAVEELLGHLDPDHGYVAIQAYLDRFGHPAYAELRELLAARTGRPVTFGWGPRFLHSTGQLHKGGPPTGVFLQITDTPEQDLEVPGRDFSFGTFIAAQSAGDAHILREHGRPVLRLHLADAAAALPILRDLLA